MRELFYEQLQQGCCPRDLALAFALGATLGIMPLVWGTSLICIIIASCLRINQVVIQGANYLMYPLQIILFFPYLIWGERLFATHLLPANHTQLLEQIRSMPFVFLGQFWQSNVQGLVVWLILSPAIFALLFGGVVLLLKKFHPLATQ
ncbi:DUF2062 domain-containing protein [uncultured Desulfuromusa sp.]|uniref:DUF2062 domain-containing protein n=1 Tax=uncultured Desulfuromusa sp. TaxID=219183 RepID=UPI002AA87E77|nr:DUF2062 domain-containing protein [uncultured Desulfuromusa sp.]